jgi:hypothetical protein
MLHLYALANQPVRLPEAHGIEEAPLESVRIDGIDAVLSNTAPDQAKATEERILVHARVVEQLSALNAAVLPARFGAAYDDRAALVEAVRRREVPLRDALDRVRGCSEMGLRIVDPDASVDAPVASGGEYMRRRLNRIRDAEHVAAEIDEAIGGVARDTKTQILASAQFLFTAAYLVRREEAESFRATVSAVESRHPELVFVCTGPWPPYSFALVDDEPAG